MLLKISFVLLQSCNIGTVSSVEPLPGVEPSADDSSNSLVEINLYDHETSGEIPEKVSVGILFVLVIPFYSKKGGAG